MPHFVRSFKRRKKFLDELTLGSSETAAARAADGSLRDFRAWRRSDPDFAQDWADAIEEGTDLLEDEAVQRALKKSDPLMMFMLKARRPEKFDKASKLELSGGISVEGSKAKLLNKLARLKAARALPATSEEEESGVSPTEDGPIEEPARLLPDHSRKSAGGRA
jgi:hypothetical protein